MTKRELNRQIARRTGEDVSTITRLGFSLVETRPADEDEWETQAVDWDEPAYPRSQWFRHRQSHRTAQ